ncbi:MAG: MBL fold metallo-hydrolase [Bacteroidota bacterium]
MVHTLDLHFKVESAIASFLVETSEGPVLVETGPHSTFEMLKKGLATHGYTPADIQHVFLTHIHFDHAGGAWAFAETGAKVYVHPFGYKHMLDPTKLYNSAKRIYGDEMESLWGEMHAIPADQLISVEDESEIQVGDHTFKALHTPGHASHHIAWQIGEEIFTGDVAGCRVNLGPVVPPCPPPDIDVEAWERSIQRILSLNPQKLYLTHYGEVTDIQAHFGELSERLQGWKAWMKPYFEAGTSPAEVTPKFQAFAAKELRDAGVPEDEIPMYEAANPAWMSVAGLLRYWKKYLEKQG